MRLEEVAKRTWGHIPKDRSLQKKGGLYINERRSELSCELT